MKSFSLLAAAVAATLVHGACSAGAPMGPVSPAVTPSFELSISSDTSVSLVADTTTVLTACPAIVPVTDTIAQVPVADTTVGTAGTYAVAYGTPDCIPSP